MLNLFKQFKHSYDPINFRLIYSLKAVLAVVLSAYFGYYFFGFIGALFAVKISSSMFFMANLDGTDAKKLLLLSLYILLAVLFVPFIKPMLSLGMWLVPVVFVWVFIVSYSQVYSENLNKILLATNVIGFAGFITYGNYDEISLTNCIGAIILAGAISTIIKLGRLGKYGTFTIKSIKTLTKELIALANALGSKEFDELSREYFERINEFKELFSNDSINIKDSSLIKNQNRAIFYIYRLEEIGYLLTCIDSFYLRIDDKKILKDVKDELIHNLNEVFKIFTKQNPEYKTSMSETLKLKNYKVFANSVDIINQKLAQINDANNEKIELKNDKQLSFKKAIKNIGLKDNDTLNSLRLAICMAIAIFITQMWHINHGLWIAVAVMSMSKNSLYSLNNAARDNVFGGIFGFFIGIFTALVIDSIYIYVALGIGMFLMFYFKPYKQFVFTTIFMAVFSMVYTIIKDDYMQLLLERIFDIFIGFGVVYIVSIISLPKNKKEFEIKLTNVINSFILLIDDELSKKQKFIADENEIIQEISNYKEFSDETGYKNTAKIYTILNNINKELINLRNYITSQHIDDINLQNDIITIKSRFEMLDKKLQGLPYYFITSMDGKITYKNDTKVTKILERIALRQNDLYLLSSL
ncbi:FUSC family protein [Campylobacter majalis]|uniref:FUSC family protein n=1 Tax=Campylobacter majalis TaxID=2790656 RepID=UPI003D6827B4